MIIYLLCLPFVFMSAYWLCKLLTVGEEDKANRKRNLTMVAGTGIGGLIYRKPEKECCKNCRYWKQHATAEELAQPQPPNYLVNHGECRLKGPVIHRWPETFMDDYCGEFKSK